MISIRSLSLPIFALVATLAGCSGESGTTSGAGTPDTAKSEVVAQSDTANRPEHGPGHHHGPGGPGGGPELLIGAALHAPINLTDAQRTTIEGLAKSGHPAFDASKAKELAAAVRAGNVSTLSRPAPDLAAAAKSIATLHDTLTPAQRLALVDAIASHAPKGAGPRGPEGRDRPLAAHGEHMAPRMPFGEGLDLTDAQKEQLKTKMEANHPAKPTDAQIEAMHAAMNAKLESFKADSFDANAFVAPPQGLEPGAMKGNPLQDLVSVLTPEQREKLAQRIEQGPPAHAK